jgi:4-amino-4-deoxy-L-arabinose transferase-like glycosyltransferase
LAGVRSAVTALIMVGIYLPFYTMAASFYSDVLSLPFTALTLNFYLRARDQDQFQRKLVMFIACGLLAAVGSVIKFTVFVVLVACVIDWFLANQEWSWAKLKKPLLGVASAACAFAALTSGFYAYMDSKMDPDLVYQHREPMTSWILCGLGPNGGAYNPEYSNFTMSLPNIDVRREEIPLRIKQRLQELGFFGLIEHFGKKYSIAYESGTFKQNDFIGLPALNKTALHEWVVRPGNYGSHEQLYGDISHVGQYYDAYDHIATGLMLSYFLLGMAGAFIYFRKPGFCVPWLSLIGLNIFFLIWESSNKIAGFFPIFVMCAVLGLSALPRQEKKGNTKKTSKRTG